MYKAAVDKLVNEVARDLKSSAQSYYNIGIGVFNESRLKNWIAFQPAIGNLAISVELLIKAIVAQKAIMLLYSNLTDEAKLLLCYPESLSDQHNLESNLSDIKNFSFKAIELDKAVSLFYLFYPKLRHEYKHFFSSLATIRNVSVHASIPDFQRYELDRMAYFSTKLFTEASQLKILKFFHFQPHKKTENFMEYYKDEKIKKVKTALENARQIVKSGKLKEANYCLEDWQSMHVFCPICENTATYFGETEEDQGDDGINLTFEAESFTCEACGLELEDFEELQLAGMETSIDREHDVDQWIEECVYRSDYDDR